MRGGRWNTLWAEAFMEELGRAGVDTVVVAPGSRSTPLVLAAARLACFRMISVVDERCAGFLALGVGKASGRPAAVITTSGTAGANLYPAVIEAAMGDVPLLALTADRPHRLRDAGGNQAMDQLRLFGTFPRAFFEVAPPGSDEASLRHLRGLASRAVSLAEWGPPGPVHLNFPFEKPLEPLAPGQDPETEGLLASMRAGHGESGSGRREGGPYTRIVWGGHEVPRESLDRYAQAVAEGRRGLIVAGPVPDPGDVGPAVLRLGAATGFPILADPLSGARFTPHEGATVVPGYDLFLRSPAARENLKPDLVLRVGGSPTSAAALSFLAANGGVRQIVVDRGSRWKDHLAMAHDYVWADPAHFLDALREGFGGEVDREWTMRWSEAGARTLAVLEEMGGGELLEGQVLASVVRSLPEGSTLFVGSSMPIRDLDAFAPPSGKTLRVLGNRGVSGIDGLVSTAVGIASWPVGGEGPREGKPTGEEGAPPTVAVLGDLAFLHDMNGLHSMKTLRPSLVLVVVNNDGGGIFEMLPVRDHEPAFTRYFSSPHGLDLWKAAHLYDLPFHGTDSLGAFQEELRRGLSEGGPRILEVRTRRRETHRRRREVVEAVCRAMEEG